MAGKATTGGKNGSKEEQSADKPHIPNLGISGRTVNWKLFLHQKMRTTAFFVVLGRAAYWKKSLKKYSESLHFPAVTTYLHQRRNNQVLCDHSVSQKIPLHFFQLTELLVHNFRYFVLHSPQEMLKTYDSIVYCRPLVH